MPERLWVYEDRLGLNQAVVLGMQRAQSGDWASGSLGERVRAFNGWLLQNANTMAEAWGEVSQNPNAPEVYIYPSQKRPVSQERKRLAVGLYRSIWLIADDALSDDGNVTTVYAPGKEEVGAWPVVAGIAIVAVSQAVAFAFCAQRAAEIVDRHLARKAELQKLIQRDKAVLDLAAQHQKNEAAAGKPLPLDPVTKAALESLLRQQEEIIRKRETPLSNPLPPLPSLSELAIPTTSFGLGALAAIIGIGVIVVWSK